MDMKEITGKEWLKYGVLYPLGLILLAAALESLERMFFVS